MIQLLDEIGVTYDRVMISLRSDGFYQAMVVGVREKLPKSGLISTIYSLAADPTSSVESLELKIRRANAENRLVVSHQKDNTE